MFKCLTFLTCLTFKRLKNILNVFKMCPINVGGVVFCEWYEKQL